MCCFILYIRIREILCQVPRLSPIASHPRRKIQDFALCAACNEPVDRPHVHQVLNCLRPDDVVVHPKQEGTPLSVSETQLTLHQRLQGSRRIVSHHGIKQTD